MYIKLEHLYVQCYKGLYTHTTYLTKKQLHTDCYVKYIEYYILNKLSILYDAL